jgi:hypothetical protein
MQPTERSLEQAREWLKGEQGLDADIFVGGDPVSDAWSAISRSLAALLDKHEDTVGQEQHEATMKAVTSRFAEFAEGSCHVLHETGGWAHAEAQSSYRFASAVVGICESIAAAPPPTGGQTNDLGPPTGETE